MIIHAISNKDYKKLPDSPKAHCDHLLELIADADAMREKSPDILTIFVAPENYFKRHAIGKRYTFEEKNLVCEYLKDSTKNYHNMLIVAGSIAWQEPPIEHREDFEKGDVNLPDNKKDRVHNSSLILFEGNSFLYHKKDDMDVSPNLPEVFVVPPGMHGVFEAAGMTMGISICGDSPMLMDDYPKVRPNGPGVDVHFLIAEGQTLGSKDCMARAGGLAIGACCQKPEFKVCRMNPEHNFEEEEKPFVIGEGEGGDSTKRLYVFPPMPAPPHEE